MITPKPKPCKICKQLFNPRSTTAQVCGLDCAIEFSAKKTKKDADKIARAGRIAHRQAIIKAKTRGEWLKEAQTAYNAWIRARDNGLSCISCGGFTGKQNAGHYRSVGSAPELRFEPLNCHLQCEKCNTHLSGNLINYRVNLIKRIGLDKVEWIEGKHEPKKYTIDEVKAIKSMYKTKIKDIA